MLTWYVPSTSLTNALMIGTTCSPLWTGLNVSVTGRASSIAAASTLRTFAAIASRYCPQPISESNPPSSPYHRFLVARSV